MNIQKLKPLEKNPFKGKGDKQLKLIAESIESFEKMMTIRKIVIDENFEILGGNKRYFACKMLGKTEIPDEWIDQRTDLTEAEKKEFIVKDNAHWGSEWDMDILKEWKVDTEAWGVLPSWDEKPEAHEDDYEIPDEIQTDIVVGDLFEIGVHRLLCGDSTDSEQVARLMNGENADMVFTDPPYSSGGYQESGKTNGSIGARGSKKIATDNLSTRGYISLMDKVLANLHTAHSLFVFCDWKMWVYNQDISEAKGYRVRNMLVWDKMQMGMGMPFRNQHELCLFGSKIAGKIGDGNTPNVLSFKRDREAVHFTPKPIPLIFEIVKQIESENIIDPFLGGGSTMVAAHQLNRKCYGMELEPKYCQVIVDRMRKLDPGLVIKKNGATI